MTSITRFNILATLTTGILLAISVGYFFIYLPHSNYDEQANQLRANYIATYKKAIQNETNRTLKHLIDLHSDFEKDSDFHLSLHASALEHIVTDLVEAPNTPPEQQAREIYDAVSNSGFDNQEIFFIFNENNQLVYDSESRRPSIDKLPERMTQSQILQLLAQPATASPTTLVLQPKGTAHKTLRFINKTSATNHWRVVLAFSTREMEEILQYRFLERLAKVRFGTDNSGYFFVLNSNAKPLMIGALQTGVNEDLSPLPLNDIMRPIADHFIELSRTGGGFHQFEFPNPAHNNEIEDKIAYVSPVPYWGWTIGTGFYTSDLSNSIQDGQEQLLENTQERIQIGYMVIAINLIAGLAIATYTNRHVHMLEAKRAAHLQTLEQYKQVLDEICLVSKSDVQGNITYVNDGFCAVSGYTKEELIGMPHSTIRHPSVPKSLFTDMWQLIQTGISWRGINKNRAKNGSSFYVDTVISPLTNGQGEIVEFIAARYDITELLEKRDEIKSIFATDSLTTLNTRHQLIEDLNIDTPTKCLALFDIDDFHGINNHLGIDGADMVLRYVSNHMIDFFAHKNCRLYRLHSDIFAVLSLENINPLSDHCHQFLKRLHDNPVTTENGEKLSITLVTGVACNAENLINCADTALLQAKKDNKDLVVYTPSQEGGQDKSRTYWINQVQTAIIEQRLIPFYQPIINLETGVIEKYEALMRLIDKEGQPIPPGNFLPILEQTRYYPEMTRSMVEQACCFFSTRTDEFSINLSLDDLLRSRTVEFILATAEKYGVTNRIVLEVVETENVQNYDLALNVLHLLRDHGMAIAIDDFGSGYANFSYLSEFPAAFVKIDGSLISKINQDSKTKTLVKTLIDYAHQGGMKVIAEFVSDAAILKTITELGCDYGQGYHLGQPTPANEIAPPQNS